MSIGFTSARWLIAERIRTKSDVMKQKRDAMNGALFDGDAVDAGGVSEERGVREDRDERRDGKDQQSA